MLASSHWSPFRCREVGCVPRHVASEISGIQARQKSQILRAWGKTCTQQFLYPVGVPVNIPWG